MKAIGEGRGVAEVAAGAHATCPACTVLQMTLATRAARNARYAHTCAYVTTKYTELPIVKHKIELRCDKLPIHRLACVCHSHQYAHELLVLTAHVLAVVFSLWPGADVPPPTQPSSRHKELDLLRLSLLPA